MLSYKVVKAWDDNDPNLSEVYKLQSNNMQNKSCIEIHKDTIKNGIEFTIAVGCLYFIQYKSIFGVPDKVRCDTCDKARPLSQAWGVEPNTSLGYEVAEPPHHHQIIVGMQDCIPM